jgi:predicted peptidase
VPHGYNPAKEYPVILFLHGSGGRGTDGKKPSQGGLAGAIRINEKAFNFIAVFPQAENGWTAGGQDANRALASLDEVTKQYKVDGKRAYMTGLSLGGFGTWSIAAATPERWAAIVPICGGGNPKNADKIKDIPCWCLHGDKDDVVKVERSRDMNKSIKDAGGSPRYTEYPGVGHNSWDRAYATGELYAWLIKQKLK